MNREKEVPLSYLFSIEMLYFQVRFKNEDFCRNITFRKIV
jgi:hypothetical protein